MLVLFKEREKQNIESENCGTRGALFILIVENRYS